jgi:hypothetical protein
MVDPEGSQSLGETTIDGAFLEDLCSDPSRLHVVEDSDEIMGFELSPWDQFPTAPPGLANPFRIGQFYDVNATPLHQTFLRRKIRVHHTDCSPAWDAVELASDRSLARAEGHRCKAQFNPGHLRRRVDAFRAEWDDRAPRVAIFGAGPHTDRLFQWTEVARLNLVGLVDGDPGLQGQKKFGFPVRSREEILDLRPEVVLISSYYRFQEIYESLRSLEGLGVALRGFYGPLIPAAVLDRERF